MVCQKVKIKNPAGLHLRENYATRRSNTNQRFLFREEQ